MSKPGFVFDPSIGLLDGIAKCAEHGDPLVSVIDAEGQEGYLCLFEAVNAYAGMRRVVGVAEADGKLEKITFENGAALTPLCPHCEKTEIDYIGNSPLGLTLVEMRWGDMAGFPALWMGFSATASGKPSVNLPVALESVKTFTMVE